MQKPYLAAIIVLIAAVPQSACVTVFEHETLPTLITVQLWSDRSPVRQVLVRVRYNHESLIIPIVALKFNKPSDAEGATNDSGAVVLPIADFRRGTILVVGENPENPFRGVASLLLYPHEIRRGGEFLATSFLIDGERSPELRIIVQRPAPALRTEEAETPR